MKKIMIILFTALSISSYAQVNFPTSNTIWNYEVSGENSLIGYSKTKTVYFTICNDTVVNGHIYNKLFTTFDTIICGNNLGELIGGFRQEEQKVYFIPYNKASTYYPAYFAAEFLLYDFGVSVGDTVHIEYNCRYYLFKWQYQDKIGFDFEFYEPKTLIVSDIEILENGIKKIDLQATDGIYGDVWYEGMGSPYGLFNAGKILVLDGYSFNFFLNCFKYDDAVKYINNIECNKCFCKNYINIREENTNTKILNMYPNPAENVLNIEVEENIEIKSISIYSMDGKLIKKNEYFIHSQQLDISDLETGNYIINIETNKGNFNQIIIKN